MAVIRRDGHEEETEAHIAEAVETVGGHAEGGEESQSKSEASVTAAMEQGHPVAEPVRRKRQEEEVSRGTVDP